MSDKKNLFKPGQSGNPNGRPKGAKNRTTEEIRKHIQFVLDGQYQSLEADLDSMSPFQRVMMVEKLTKFFLPALAKNENDTNVLGEVKVTVSFVDTPMRDNDSSTNEFQVD
ncbi:hypothetical protein BDD43_2828 [Mucilaginibacter gracilis]|uniref:DUF5681 domain-containing protein n=1 Tax=Mucilaginibacter gracilis TaxID=423350 RepID=A0A495J1H4_9SPHI|nr:DUF5681 domain-containing protein [Mucilaginibacter gracilis]RKR82643.1 hypothetical protein BDD43_2828 [Mucilaginibacter gracilis]